MEKPFINEVFTDNGEHSHWELINTEDGTLLWSEDIAESHTIRQSKNDFNTYEPSEQTINEVIMMLPNYICINVVSGELYNMNTSLKEGLDGDEVVYDVYENGVKITKIGTIKHYSNFQVVTTYQHGCDILTAEDARKKIINKNKKWKNG